MQALRGELKSLCMNDSKLISDYFDQAQTIVNQMWLMVKKLDDQWIVKKIMLSLNVKFDYATIVIKEGNDISSLSQSRGWWIYCVRMNNK